MTIARTDPHLMAVARGDRPADAIFRNGRVVNVFTREIEEVPVAIYGGRIASVGVDADADLVVDLDGRYLAPGLIDAHMHVESTMMLPREFVRVAAPHGTTGVVFDPHEIANVLGLEGIRFLMDECRGLPMDIMFAVSSCVPSSAMETSGARLEAGDLAPLFDEPNVVALAEMMNYPGVFLADPGVLAKVALGLDRAIVDGHCPGLTGAPLRAYAAAGITSDHECTRPEEALEKIRLGMRIYLREGSAAKNIEALVPVVNETNAHRFCFCTDDRHPGDLRHEGHIDHVVRKAVRLGLDPVTALAMASLHAAEHYRRPDIGAIAPGRFADMIVFDDLQDIRPHRVIFRGQTIAEHGQMTVETEVAGEGGHPSARRSTVHLPVGLSEASFRIKSTAPGQIRVIGMDPTQLVTAEHHMDPMVDDGLCVADPGRDLLKIAVIARHNITEGVGLGFVTGFGFKDGALASTVGHDAHNLAVVGTNDADMLVAAKALEQSHGGQCVVQHGKVVALLPLPIAGLLSDAEAPEVIEQQHALLEAAHSIGCPLDDPFMPLSFMPLPVIPKLKLTDLGLVDVESQTVVPLFVGANA
ncbi:MAG: adenine deaminase [Phycisphaeraceae bacterium]|nr:MAG: adenine deaminase [Phycisphaeraceae bacterium]